MRTDHRSRGCTLAAIVAGVWLLSAAPGAARADEESPDTSTEEKADPVAPEPRYEVLAPEPSASKTTASVLYVPPAIGFPGRRIGAGTRGMGRLASLQILAPDHLGYTTEEQPTLYWYLAAPTSLRIDFTIRDETSVEPLLEVQLPAPAHGGIQAVRLAGHGVRLLTGTNYHWFVSLVPDAGRRSKDFAVGAWVRRRDPDPALRRKLAAANGREASVYAESGLWYDAIGALSSGIDASPQDADLREQRAALLEQAGLSEVAAFDRGAASQH